jgi:sugar-specific transcriptional regulator TrmB
MTQPQILAVPKQSARIYRLLTDADDLTAKQIGEKLNILPNTVYRSMKPLIELGMAEELSTYPIRYKANPTADAMNWYLRAAAQSFRQEFGSQAPKHVDDSVPSISFIRNREHLLELEAQDARQATATINYIVSGHGIPDNAVLAFRKAATIGVRIRAIIQNTPETTNYSLENYQDMGVEVRYLPDIGIRLFVFDSHIAYLTSYDNKQSSRAFGIRFSYSPVAIQLDQLFEQLWQQAKALD